MISVLQIVPGDIHMPSTMPLLKMDKKHVREPGDTWKILHLQVLSADGAGLTSSNPDLCLQI